MSICNRRLAALVAVGSIALAAFTPPSASAGGTWSTHRSMPSPVSGAGTAVLGGMIYAAGGFSTNSTCDSVASLWAYDPATDQWSARASLPSPRSQSAVAAVGGKLYLFGGARPCGEIEMTDALAYDPLANAWTPISPVPGTPAGLNASGAIAVDGKVYLIGGLRGDPNQWVTDVFVYDPATDSYAARAPMPQPRYSSAIAAKDGRIYVMGGQPGLNNEVQVYDIASNTWTTGTPMPLGNCCTEGALVGERIYVLGVNVSASYHLPTGTWRSEPQMPTPRYNAAIGTIDGVVYVAGGQGLSLRATGVLEAFTPEPANRPPIADAGPNKRLAAGPSCTAQAALDGSGSSDPDGDPLSYAWSGNFGTASGVAPSVALGLGTHAISLTVSDGRGGSATDTTQVSVADTSAPQIVAQGATPATLWPPNHRMVEVQVNASAADNCGVARCRVVSVSSNEGTNALGDGNTSPDWAITGDLAVKLRAERSGTGSGRVYTVGLKCTDTAGNEASGAVRVEVRR